MKLKLVMLVMLCFAFVSVAIAQDGSGDEDLLAGLQQIIDAGDPGIVVALNVEGEFYVAAYGSADIESGESVEIGDLFRIGSVTKPMVSVVLLSLVDAGEIDLDDLIADYLPAEIVENVMNADTATMRQMLNMTSGIFSYTESNAFDDAVLDDPTHPWTAAETITYIYGEEPYFAPGEGYYYSNSNYNLAQIIIEGITGQSLADALESVIFEPLSMDSCYLETPDRFAQGIVRGYSSDGGFTDMTEENDGVGMGDGGVICNAEDLAKFLPGLVEEEILSEEILEEMLTTVDDGDGGQYGLGIGYEEGEFGMTVSHDGSTSGFQSTTLYLPEEGISVAVLTNNFDADYVEDVALGALELAFGE